MSVNRERIGSRIVSYGEPTSGAEPYQPFLSAIQQEVFTPTPDFLGEDSGEPGLHIRNCRLPNVQGRGVVASPKNGLLAGIDHVAIELGERELCIYPTEQSAVDEVGVLLQPGGISMETTEGRLKLLGVAVDLGKDPWAPARFRDGWFMSRVGNMGIFMAMLGGPEYEVTGIDSEGNQQAKRVD